MARALRIAGIVVLSAIAVFTILKQKHVSAIVTQMTATAPVVTVGPSSLTDEDRAFLATLQDLTKADITALSFDETQETILRLESLSSRLPSVRSDEPLGGGDVIVQGTLQGADLFHPASGRARIVRTAGGGYSVELEDLSVQNAPALRVALSMDHDGDPRDHALLLGPLKGNLGNQSYPVPAGASLGTYQSLTIYALPFSTVYAVALLR